ncbi:MAG: hypothetical protein U0324_05685 [Polyangiales bacterium]
MDRARRHDGSPWSDETPAPVGRDTETLPLGTQPPHWTQVDTAHDGTPVMLRDVPAASGERSFLGPDEPTEATGSRFDAAAPATLPLGTGVAPAPALPGPPMPPAGLAPAPLPPTREVPSAPSATHSPVLSTALPPRPSPWSPRPASEAPAAAPASARATLLAGAAALVLLAAVVFAYLVLAAPK